MAPLRLLTLVLFASFALTLLLSCRAHEEHAVTKLPKVAQLAYAQNGYQHPNNIPAQHTTAFQLALQQAYRNGYQRGYQQGLQKAQQQAQVNPALTPARQAALKQRQATVQRQAALRRQAVLQRQVALRRQQAALKRSQAAKGLPQATVQPAVTANPGVTVQPAVTVPQAVQPAMTGDADEDTGTWDLKCVDPLDLCAGNTPEQGTVQLSVEQQRAPMMQGAQYYLNGVFSADMKLPGGNSGGVNWAFYMMAPGDNKNDVQTANQDPEHNEIDIIFYGNDPASAVTLNCNVFANNKHNLAEFTLPFDPSADFHTYAIKWSPTQIVFTLDGTVMHTVDKVDGSPWPTKAMYAMASGWATPWTPLQADYSNGPIRGWIRNVRLSGCPANDGDEQNAGGSQCDGPWNEGLSEGQQGELQAAHAAHLVKDHGWDNA